MGCYEAEQKRLQKLFDEVMSDEEIEAEDPFACSSASEYIPSDSDSSTDSVKRVKTRRKSVQVQDYNASVPGTSKNVDKNIQETIESVITGFTVDSEESDQADDLDTSTELKWGPIDVQKLKNFNFQCQNSGIRDEFFTMYDKAPYDFYRLFLTDEILELITEQTNIYANQKANNKDPSRKTKSKPWVPTNTEEIKTFFGIIIWMGLFKLPQLRDYWAQNFLYENNMKKIMSRNRFEQLLATLHFNDNETFNKNDREIDRLHKIAPLLEK
nr:unnamed protein product [Callosobruchus analis]